MNETGLIIVSKPVSKNNRYERHWVVRTVNDECELVISDVVIRGIIVAHANTYEEASKIVLNLLEGES